MFHVKICGVTTAADAAMVAAAGADAIGLNFVAGSPRQLGLAAAVRVARAVPSDMLLVGVFAGSPAEEILETARVVGLAAIQLHGHLNAAAGPFDPPDLPAALFPLPVIRAVRMDPPGPDRLASARRWAAAAAAHGRPPGMVIVDAAVSRGTHPGLLGGTGEQVDWQALAAAEPVGSTMALAGGLTPANVAEAIRVTGLRAVDTASGVEEGPGRKDPRKVAAFVEAVRRAIDAPPSHPLRLPPRG